MTRVKLRRTLQRIWRRVGRRGAVLLFIAVMDVGIGLSFIDPTPETLALQSTMWRETFLPTWAWGWVWVAVSVMCVWGAFRSHVDEVGYMPAVGIKLVWSTTELTGWLGGHINQGYRPALVWFGFAVMILLVAGLRERESPDPPTGGGGRDAEPG